MEYGDDAEDESENSEKALPTKLVYGLTCNNLLKMKTSVLHIWMNTPKKSKSQTTCPHHFQLGCNNEWLVKKRKMANLWQVFAVTGGRILGWRWKNLEESDVYDENRRVATMLEVANAKSCSWFNPKKVLFSDNFLKSFRKLKSIQLKKSVLNLLLKLSGGWRPKKKNVQTISGSSSILRQYKVGGLYIVCTIHIAKELKYIQVLKVWDISLLEDIPKLVNRLVSIFKTYTDDFINRCNENCLEGDLEVPKCWPTFLDVPRFKDLSATEIDCDFVGDASDGRSYVENSQVSESLLLMKFYALSSGVVNHLLSDCEGKELDLPFEVTDQEVEIILYHKSTFIVGTVRNGEDNSFNHEIISN